MEPNGKVVLTTKDTTNQFEFKEAPMEEDDPNEPGDKLNELVKSELTMPLQPDIEEELVNIKSVPSSQDNDISKGTGLNLQLITNSHEYLMI